jgi:hypothetical protein
MKADRGSVEWLWKSCAFNRGFVFRLTLVVDRGGLDTDGECRLSVFLVQQEIRGELVSSRPRIGSCEK